MDTSDGPLHTDGMSVQWGRDGPGLLVALDREAGRLSAQIQARVRDAVRDGTLRVDERMPSTRHLATELGVSRGTVVEAYDQLVAEGYLRATVGSGTRVATAPEAPAPSAPAPDDAGPLVADFDYGVPDLRSAPLSDWRWAMLEAVRRLRTPQLGDGDPAGAPHLRDVISAYHRRVRAGAANGDSTVIVAGFREGLACALAALAHRGIDRIALEDPGPHEHDLLVRRAGLEAVSVPVDDAGVDVAALARSGARAVLVTPAHQCPTGAVLAPGRRRALVAWAERVDGVVLEDDYDAEFRYDRTPVGSLQGLAPQRVVALGSVSKTLVPAIRIGWVFAPPRWARDIAEEKRLRSRGAPALDQEALARLIEAGRYDRHLRRMRDLYRRRRDVLVAEVARHLGPGRVQGAAAGCHLLLRLPEGTSERRVVAAASVLGVRVHGLGRYRTTGEPDPPALVIGFGNVDEEGIRDGVQAIADAIASATATGDE